MNFSLLFVICMYCDVQYYANCFMSVCRPIYRFQHGIHRVTCDMRTN